MKKILLISVVFLMAVGLAGCMDVIVKVPEGKKVTIITGSPIGMFDLGSIDFSHVIMGHEYDAQKRIFYAGWGLIPLGNNTTDDLFEEIPDGSRVSVMTEMNLIDGVISIFGSGLSITAQTVGVKVVE